MIFNKRTGVIFLACAAIIVGAILSWRAHHALDATDAERTRFLAKNTALTTRIRDAESELAQARAGLEDGTVSGVPMMGAI